MSFESYPATIERAVLDNYWRSIQEKGRHVLAIAVAMIAAELSRGGFGDERQIEQVVLSETLNSPKPEDVKKGTKEVILEALKEGDQVYIWTVGDEGAYNDEEKQVTYPAYNFQQRKIKGSRFLESLSEQAQSESGSAESIPDNLHLSINAENKISALVSIISKARQDGIRHLYVVDDQQRNIDMAEDLQGQFPDVGIHTWRVDDSSDKGTFSKFVEEKWSNRNKGEKVVLVLDWDDTVYDEMGRMRRLIHNLQSKLAKK